MNDSGGKQDEADGAMAPMQALEPVGGLFLALAVQADGLRHEDEQGSAGCEGANDFDSEDDGHADAPFRFWWHGATALRRVAAGCAARGEVDRCNS